MNKRQIIYNVREKLKLNSDDSDTSDELIAHLVDLKRVKVLMQRMAQGTWRLPVEVKQEIKMDLEVVDSVDGMSCFGKILRTKDPIPNMIRSKGTDGGITIRRADKVSLPIDIIRLDRLPYAGNGMFLQQLTYAAFDYDNRLYLVSNQKKHLLQESILVGGAFEDVEAADELTIGIDLTVDAWDRNYPFTADLSDTVVEMVVLDLAKSAPIIEDKINDANGKPKS
jgi:hypothetical protein